MATERVLVVDDDPVILTLCQRILEVDGYVVTTVKRGEDALAKLDAEPFDLLLTDIRLPGLNGLDVTMRLRERGLDLTVVTMTGYSNMEMAIQALSLGVDEFIIKPFTPDSLRLHVTRALEKWHLRRENLRLRMLVPLLQTAQAFAASRTRAQVYRELFDAVQALLPVEELAFLALDGEQNKLSIEAAQGRAFSPLSGQVFFASQFPEPELYRADGIQVWNQQETGRLPVALDLGWLAGIPLRTRDRTFGFLLIGTSPPSHGDLESLSLTAAQAATAIENVDLLEEISRAYVDLRELEHLKSEFINIAGHELRTPLAVLLGYASLLRDQLDGEPQTFAREVVANAERLQRIANDMLNLKYLENGQGDLNLEACTVPDVVRDVVNAYLPLAVEREQAIENRVNGEAGQLYADRAMLDLILGSLLSNAIKFSPRKATIFVTAEGDADRLTLRVRDEGPGLTPEQASHIFDAFYQAGDSLTRREGGMGLGLTLAREMVRAHGGIIWVESEYARGSSFYVMLPRNGRGAVKTRTFDSPPLF